MATFSFTLVVDGIAATNATFTPSAAKFTAPVPPGTVVGTVTVDPPSWSGIITVDAPFSMRGNDVVVGSTALAKGTYISNGLASP